MSDEKHGHGEHGGHNESHGDGHDEHAEEHSEHSEGHSEHSSNHGGNNKEGNDIAGAVDRFFGKVADFVTKSVSVFVAFLFLLFTAGAVYGIAVTQSNSQFAGLLIIAPAVFGLLTYKFKQLALALFVIVILVLMVLI